MSPPRRPPPRRLPAYPSNPLAPLPEPLLQRQVRGDVRANTLPLIRQINRQARYGSQNISGIAQQLAGSLGAVAGKQAEIYSAAQNDLSHIDTAIADRLAAAGQHDAAALHAKMALQGTPSALAESLAGGAAQTGLGASAAGFTRGSAESAALNARGADAQSYAAKMPGIARLAGLQDVSQLEAGVQQQIGKIAAGTPSLVASLTAAARGREVTKGLGNLGYQGNVLSAQTSQANTGARVGATNTSTQSRAQIAAANRKAAARRQRYAEAQKNRRANAAQINANRRARMRGNKPGGKTGKKIIVPRSGQQ